MANVMKIQPYGGSTTTISFSPLDGYFQPDYINRRYIISANGTLYTYDFSSRKQKHDVPINNIPYASAVSINAWWAAGTTIVFWADLVNGTNTTIRIKLVNETRPLQMWFDTGTWRTTYHGTLMIQEI